MGLESPFTGKYITDLNEAWPIGTTDAKSQGDDHLRGIKQVLKNSFAGVSGAVTSTHTELNLLDGCTLTLAGKSFSSSDDVIDNFPAGTIMSFQQTAAPTGWTKESTHNDKALRVVTGTASSGGTAAFTTVFSASTATDSDGAHTHTTSGTAAATGMGGAGISYGGQDVVSVQEHTHSVTGTAASNGAHTHTISELAVQYVDIILAAKD